MDQFEVELSDGRVLTVQAPNEGVARSYGQQWAASNPDISTTADIAKATIPALTRGTAQLAGAGGDLRDMVVNSGAWLAKLIGASDEGIGWGRTAVDTMLRGLPITSGKTSQQILNTIKPVTGDLYRAQTPIGKMAESGLEIVPSVIAGPQNAGRSILSNIGRNAVRYGMIPGAAGEYAGQVAEDAYGPEAKPYAKLAGTVLTGGALAARDRPLVTPQMNVGNNVAPTFGIPLTRGQANRDVSGQIVEQAALRGGYGPQAQQTAGDFFAGQAAATERARGGIGQSLDRFGAPVVDDAQAAANTVNESVRSAERISRGNYNQAYREAFDQPGEFHAGAFEGVGQRIKGRLTLGDNPVIIDDVTTPVASRAIQDVDNQISQLRVQNRADPFGQPNPENIVGINMQGVDQTRKRLVAFAQSAAPGSADRRAVSRVISEFDNEVESAMANGLFSGDDRALDAIRNARQLYSQHRRLYSSQGRGDDVGRAMEKIVGRDNGLGATAQETANYLYGESNVGAKGLSVRLAQRLRNVLGEDSVEWTGIRQGLWARLTHATPGATDWGPQKVAQRITEFLNGNGQPMSHVVFSPAERREMARFAQALREMVPPPGAVNTSNTATVMSRMVATSLDAIAGMLGFAATGGNPAGLGAAWASRIVRPQLQDTVNNYRVRRSLYNQAYRTGTGEAVGRTGLVAAGSR